MVISGLYVETTLGKAQQVAEELVKIKGVEVHHVHEEVKVILTLETETVDQSYRIAETFKEITDVRAICLVYTNFEDEPFYQGAADVQ
jgi:periplasmic nitrate reductase NapD